MLVRGYHDGRNISPEIIDYWLMQQFHCLPSELDREDNARLMRFLNIHTLFENERHALQASQTNRR